MKSSLSQAGAKFRIRVSAALAAFLVLLALPPRLRAAPVSTGTVVGQVSNGVTKSNLPGASVTVDDRVRGITTERDGSYRITGLPPGTHHLSIEYPGLDAQAFTVAVGAGTEVRQDAVLTSGLYTLDTFMVTGEREGNAAAIVAQRNAINAQNTLTSDAFGNIAKGNIGNFLMRLPGVAGTTDEVETENIVLRGMGAEFTSLDIDGASATDGGGGRNQSAASIPADMIERVVVTKAATPDMDANSLGGRVNLITKSAYDRQGREFTLRLADSYSLTYGDDVGRNRSNALAPSFGASYSDVFSVAGGERNLGLHLNANWERILDVRGTTSWAQYTQPDSDGPEYPRFDNVSTALHGIDRGGLMAKVDFKASPNLSLGTTVTLRTYTNDMFRTRNRLRSGTVRPEATPGLDYVVIDGAAYGTERGTRHRVDDTFSTSVYGKWRNDAGWRVDGSVDVSRTRREEQVVTLKLVSNRKLDYVLDRTAATGDRNWPELRVFGDLYTGSTHHTSTTPTSFLDVNPFGDDFSNAKFDGDGQWQDKFQDNQRTKAKVDVTRAFDTRWPFELKSGLSLSAKSNQARREELRGKLNTSSSAFGSDFSGVLDDTWDLGGAIGRYPVGAVVDNDKVSAIAGIAFAGDAADPAARWNYDPSVFAINTGSTRENTLKNANQVWEDVAAGYIQGTLEVGKLNILTGVRYERTDVKRDQVLRDRSQSGTLAEWTTREVRKSHYDDFFPSIHFRYDFSKQFLARLSYNRTAGRPNWGNILGTTDVDDEDHQISVPNLDLRPRVSDNFDFSLEYYFRPVGVLSVGVFQKNIRDFDAKVTWDVSAEEARRYGANPNPDDTTLWEISTKDNVGTGRVRGIEFNYSHQLSEVLPGPWRGLGVFANYTRLTTVGTFSLDATGDAPARRNRLEKFIPQTGNAGLSYVYNRYDLRLSWNYTGAWDENTQLSNISKTKVRGARWTLDFSGKVALTEKLTAFVDLVNLTENHGTKYRGYVDPLHQAETNALGFLLTAGVQAKF